MTTPIPDLPLETLTFGKVIARFAMTSLDSADADDAPDIVPVDGTVTLTPLSGQGALVGETFVFDKTFTAPIIAGVLSTRTGEPGVKLRVGQWRATFALLGGNALAPVDFTVTAAHTTSAPLNILAGAAPIGPVLTPSQYSVLDERLLDYVNRQAYAGGHYSALNYVNIDRDVAVVRAAPTLTGPADVQSLAGDGWDLTGKGGLYRVVVYGGFYWATNPAGTTNTSMSYQLRKVGDGNLIASSFASPGPGFNSYYGWSKEHYIQIPDDCGPVEWVLQVTPNGGATTGQVNTMFEFDFERVAGWPVS